MSRSILLASMARTDGITKVDLRRVRYFVAVAEERHFGRAATRLHMSAPPLSQRIQELERDLGITLFDRTSRRVELTVAGERLLVEARAVLRAADTFEQLAQELSATPNELGFGFCHGSEGGAMNALRRFRAELPHVVVRPAAMTSLHIADSIRSGRLAAGILRGPVADPDRVASVPLARVPVDHVVLPASHRLGAQAIIQATDLDGEPVLIVERVDAPRAHDEIVSYMTRLGAKPKWTTHGATQIERVFDMVAIGSGIGWLNTWQAERDLGRDDITVRPLQPVGLWDEFSVAWRNGDSRPSTAACVRIVLETCGG